MFLKLNKILCICFYGFGKSSITLAWCSLCISYFLLNIGLLLGISISNAGGLERLLEVKVKLLKPFTMHN